MVHGPLFNASWTDDQSLIRRPRRFRVKPSLTRDLIWTALVQQKLQLNRGQGHIWTWFKLDRRWWNAPLAYDVVQEITSSLDIWLVERCVWGPRLSWLWTSSCMWSTYSAVWNVQRRTVCCHMCFHDLFYIICKPDSCLHHLLPPSRGPRHFHHLQNTFFHISPSSNLTNQKFQSFLNFALNNY